MFSGNGNEIVFFITIVTFPCLYATSSACILRSGESRKDRTAVGNISLRSSCVSKLIECVFSINCPTLSRHRSIQVPRLCLGFWVFSLNELILTGVSTSLSATFRSVGYRCGRVEFAQISCNKPINLRKQTRTSNICALQHVHTQVHIYSDIHTKCTRTHTHKQVRHALMFPPVLACHSCVTHQLSLG